MLHSLFLFLQASDLSMLWVGKLDKTLHISSWDGVWNGKITSKLLH